MKKLLAVLLAVCVLGGCSVCFAENVTAIDTLILHSMGYSAEEWYSNALNQALFTVLAIVEYNVAVHEGDATIDWDKDTYVGITDDVIVASFYDMEKEEYVALLYSYEEETFAYIDITVTSSILAELVMDETCTEYEKNDPEVLKEVVSLVADVIAE